MNCLKKISGSSIVESVIAIAIIAFCMGIGLMVFVKITEHRSVQDSYALASQLKEELAAEVLKETSVREAVWIPADQMLGTKNIKLEKAGDTLDFDLWTYKTSKP